MVGEMLNATAYAIVHGMSAGFEPEQKTRDKMQLWFVRNQTRLLAIDIICVTLLFFSYLLTSTFQTLSAELLTGLHIASFVLASFIVVSVVWRGVVPAIICILGSVLIVNSIMLPSLEATLPNEVNFGGKRYMYAPYSPEAAEIAAMTHFFLGVLMVGFSIIVAYKPALLFARNRPISLDAEWAKYPVWHDNTLLADGRSEPSVPVRSLITDKDRYLLWRYEYVLANIYGTNHLVRPEGLVPKDSTAVLRDDASGMIIGKARYTGFFV
ncbi:MAG TPA: hypothetical protein VIE86_04960 [Nitrososphaera sp.]